MSAGLPASEASVVYPGVRNELFGVDRVGMPPLSTRWQPATAPEGVFRRAADGQQGGTHVD